MLIHANEVRIPHVLDIFYSFRVDNVFRPSPVPRKGYLALGHHGPCLASRYVSSADHCFDLSWTLE